VSPLAYSPRRVPRPPGARARACSYDVAVPYVPTADDPPFIRVGGADQVRALVERFYDVMGEREPALARLHPCDPSGRVDQGSRDRFAMFLIGWLGGPQDYIAQHGHPRLRMRHGRVPVDEAMRDAWLRSMAIALDDLGITGDVRVYLDGRFAEVADFMRNR
jgi:hemoglobin